jgi:pescadillo protein
MIELLTKFREIKAHLKKHKKLLGRKETKLAEEHMRKAPKYTLSHIIKERYPTFLDALRDLDDALCLNQFVCKPTPTSYSGDIRKEIEECSTLLKEFLLYCTVTQCFKKAFLNKRYILLSRNHGSVNYLGFSLPIQPKTSL